MTKIVIYTLTGLAICLSVALFFASRVAASTLGPNTAGTGADDATVGTLAWTTPGNITASDDTYAVRSTTLGGTTHYLLATNFGFAIPTTATITGIAVEVEEKRAGTCSVNDAGARLVKGGVIGSTDKLVGAWSIAEAFVAYSNSSDLWSDTWTPADINASNFGFALSVLMGVPDVSCSASVDSIRITVSYTLPSSSIVKIQGAHVVIRGGNTTIR